MAQPQETNCAPTELRTARTALPSLGCPRQPPTPTRTRAAENGGRAAALVLTYYLVISSLTSPFVTATKRSLTPLPSLTTSLLPVFQSGSFPALYARIPQNHRGGSRRDAFAQNLDATVDYSPALSDDLASAAFDFSGIKALRTQPTTATEPENDDVFGGTSISHNKKAAVSLPHVEAIPEQRTDEEEEEEEDELESPAHTMQQTRILSPVEFGPGVTFHFPSFEQQVGGGRMREATPPCPEDIPSTRLRAAVCGTARASPITHSAISRRAAAGAAAAPSTSSLLQAPPHGLLNGPSQVFMDALGFERVAIPPPPPGFQAKTDPPPRRVKTIAKNGGGGGATEPGSQARTSSTVNAAGPSAIPPRASSSSNAPPGTASSNVPPSAAASASIGTAGATAVGPSTVTAAGPSTAIPLPTSTSDQVATNDEPNPDDLDASSVTPDGPGRLRVEQRRQLDDCISEMQSKVAACAASAGLSERRILRAFAKEVEGGPPRRVNLLNRYQPYSLSAEHRLEEMRRVREEAEEDDDDLDQEERKLAYRAFMDSYGDDASEILSLYEELLLEEGDQTYLERGRLLTKVFANGEKMVSRVHQKYGLEGCVMFIGSHLNEDAQIAKCFLTPGLSELAATLHLSHDDFLGAVKLTAYNAQNRAVNTLAGRPPIPEGATTGFYAPDTTAATTATTSVPSTSTATATSASPTATRTALKRERSPANADAKHQAAKARTQSHEEDKKSLQALFRQKAKEDLGPGTADIFTDPKRPGSFVWVILGSWLKTHNIRMLGFPTDARLPGLSRVSKGASAWRVIDVRAFNRAFRARVKDGQGLRFEKFTYSSKDELSILTHDYSTPTAAGPLSAMRAAFTSSNGKALPCVDGANKMWMACFDLSKSAKALDRTAITTAIARQLDAASKPSRTDFEGDTDNEQDQEHDAEDEDNGKARLPKESAKAKGKRARANDPEYTTDTDPESEDETSPPPRKKAAAQQPTPRLTRAKAAEQIQQEGGGKEKEKPRTVRFAPRVSVAGKDTDNDNDADNDDNLPLVARPTARPTTRRTKPLRVQDSDAESELSHAPLPCLKPVVEIPYHMDISPRHRQSRPHDQVSCNEVQMDPLISCLVNTQMARPQPKPLKRKRDATADSTADGTAVPTSAGPAITAHADGATNSAVATGSVASRKRRNIDNGPIRGADTVADRTSHKRQNGNDGAIASASSTSASSASVSVRGVTPTSRKRKSGNGAIASASSASVSTHAAAPSGPIPGSNAAHAATPSAGPSNAAAAHTAPSVPASGSALLEAMLSMLTADQLAAMMARIRPREPPLRSWLSSSPFDKKKDKKGLVLEAEQWAKKLRVRKMEDGGDVASPRRRRQRHRGGRERTYALYVTAKELAGVVEERGLEVRAEVEGADNSGGGEHEDKNASEPGTPPTHGRPAQIYAKCETSNRPASPLLETA
ncbi:hypothetical protein DFH07DRAFT_776560 [Mycena maculata]|uniref:Uncharacterized protein n=1 Tax=Mycena maculata TaxID=230809 RepID=A0AAD7ILK2_9AGAR|nr:hypothetical protein DFH07DRAFT_776560 [Mycena maculata]